VVAPSTTYNKDFKVKHGLDVTQGGTFGGTVTVGTPTENAHAATKLYVDTKAPVAPPAASAPASPVNGQLWFNTATQHLLIYSTSLVDWINLATLYDAENMIQHIHDTAIDGTGLIVSVFNDCGFYDSVYTSDDIAGFYDSVEWNNSYDGGNPLDNFS
jgi:hypothetical protein